MRALHCPTKASQTASITHVTGFHGNRICDTLFAPAFGVMLRTFVVVTASAAAAAAAAEDRNSDTECAY